MKTILIVSAHADGLEQVIQLLAAPDAELVGVIEDKDTVKVIAETHPRLLILDATVNAQEIIHSIAEQHRSTTLPVLIISENHDTALMNYNELDSLIVDQIPVHGATLHKRISLYVNSWAAVESDIGIDFQTLLEIITEQIVCLNTDLEVVALNHHDKTVQDSTGFVGTPFTDLLSDQSQELFIQQIATVRETCDSVQFEDEHFGTYYSVTIIPTVTDGVVTAFTLTADDITKVKKQEEEISQLEQYDYLTGVSSRRTFNDFLAKSMARSRRNGRTLALCYIDLDNFKSVNSTLGHDLGDSLLKSVANRLVGLVRSSDLVARVGADEFAIILDEIRRPEDAAQVADKIIKTISEPYEFGEIPAGVTASIGISFYNGGDESREEIFKTADIAMLNAKNSGRNGYQFFSDEMHSKALSRMRLGQDLRRAVQRRQFELYYQPQVDAITGEVVALEALIRWQHHELGMVSPAEFIPLAEETRLISSIGDWVIRNATQGNMKWWAENGVTLPQLTVAINVSVQQLTDSQFPDHVANLIKESNIDPNQLEIEITETALMDNPEEAIAILERIKALGIRLAIDDFGTGYSSLTYIKRLPVDILKVDLSFVRDIGKDEKTEAIIKSTVSLAHNLGLKVVAEGVETEEQIAFLRDIKCDILQGYYFSRPLPAEELVKYLRESWQGKATVE